MKKTKFIAALLLLCAISYSCGKENLHDADLVSGGSSSAVSGGEGTDAGDSGSPGETPESGGTSSRPEFIDNTDWSGYDENEYLIGFGATDENTTPQSGADAANAPQSVGDFDASSKVSVNLSTRALTWESGDEATVYVPSTGARGTYAYDATRSQFRPKDESNIVALGSNLAYIYYPASLFTSYSEGTATVSLPGAVSANSVESLGDKLPMAGIIPAAQGVPYPTVTFRNLGSVLRVQLTGREKVTSVVLSNSSVALSGSGSVTWNGGMASSVPTLTTSGDSTSMTVPCASPVTLDEDTATEFYFLLPSSGSMSGMTVRVNFTQSDGTYTYTPYITKTRSGAMALSRNKIVKLAFRAGFFSGGDGSAANPYEIKTADDFQALGTYTTGTTAQYGYNSTAGRNYFRSTVYYKQTADINLSGKTLGPIGSVTYPFYASYDGDNKTLSNCVMTTSSLQGGLFGKCCGGTLQKIIVSGGSLTSTATDATTNAAGLLGYLDEGGTVSDCKVYSRSISGLKCGGIVGYVANGTVSGCEAHGVTVTSSGTYSETAHGYAGGVVGGTKDATISGCRCVGSAADGTGTASSISGEGVAGGIAGYIAGASGTSVISDDCYVSNTAITTTGDQAGGAVGRVYSGGTLYGRTASTSANVVDSRLGACSVQAYNAAGGLVGSNTGTIIGYQSGNSYNALVFNVTVTATNNYAGGLCGENTGTGSLSTCYANLNTVTAQNNYAGGLCGNNASSVTLTNCMARSSTIKAYNASAGTYGNYVGGLCGHLAAGASIDCSAYTADGGYGNTLEGNNCVGGVCGMQKGSVTGSSTKPVCRNSTLTAHGLYLGGVSGQVEGNISGCLVGVGDSNTLVCSDNVGGVAGYVSAAATISDCTVSRTTFSEGVSLGGIVGRINAADVSVSNCTATSLSFTAGTNNIGGIAGYVDGGGSATFTDCTVTGLTISLTGTATGNGGIIGRIGNSGKSGTASLTNCTAAGSVSSTNGTAVGGIVGLSYGPETISLTNCVNSATVSGKIYVGGIVGRMIGGNIWKCRSTAPVTASETAAGGIAGLMNGGTIQTCYVAGANSNTITAQYQVGGLVGYVNANVARAVIINSASRTAVTSTGNNGESAYNCTTGGLVGFLYSSASSEAYLCNCVAWDKVIQNTSSEASANIAGVVGYVSSLNDDSAANSVVRNCYAQMATGNLKYMNGTQCPTGGKYGGIFGQIYRGRVADCYYRCNQAGNVRSQAGETTNYTKISDAAKNGTANVNVALTLYNTRTVSVNTKKLYEVLTLGSYSGASGTTPVSIQMSNGENVQYSPWTTYTSGSNFFAVPQVLYDLGTDYYYN